MHDTVLLIFAILATIFGCVALKQLERIALIHERSADENRAWRGRLQDQLASISSQLSQQRAETKVDLRDQYNQLNRIFVQLTQLNEREQPSAFTNAAAVRGTAHTDGR